MTCIDKITVSPNGSCPSEQSQVFISGGPVSAWTLSGCSCLMDGARLPPGSHPTGQQQSYSLNQ